MSKTIDNRNFGYDIQYSSTLYLLLKAFFLYAGYGAQTHKEFLFGNSDKMAISVILVT